MKDGTYITIQSWMRSELNLKGNDLLIYSIIYSFSQDGESTYKGGLQYLADWCGCTKQGVVKNLKNLVDSGLVIKTRTGRKDCYQADIVKLSSRTVKLSLMNNIYNTKDNNTIINNSIIRKSEISETKKSKKNLFQQCAEEITLYGFSAELDSMLRDYLSLRFKIIDKPIYSVNQWKAILKKLTNELAPDDVEMQKAIVQQSIEKGYASFFPVSQSSNHRTKNVDSGVSSDQYTEEERKQIRKWQKEVVKNGGRVKF